MKKYVIIVAGGKGLRMGSSVPKQFLEIGGKPILMHTIESFFAYDEKIQVILVLPKVQVDFWKKLCEKCQFSFPIAIIEGGETRFHSVKNGLQLVEKDSLVAVHDGVRPFVSKETIQNCFFTAAQYGSAIPVVPIVDSIRRKVDTVSVSENRSDFVAVQTPQVFQSTLLKSAFSQSYSENFTDDASVVESFGETVVLVEGNKENIKITTQLDLKLAEVILNNSK